MRKTASSESRTGTSRATFTASRACTTSKSNVFSGAPLRTAATPPTTMNSTPASTNARRVAVNLWSGIQFADRQDVVQMIFQDLKPLGGSQRPHPANQRQINAVFAVAGIQA